MKKTTKKLVSLLLTLVLALSVSSVSAFAAYTPEWVDDVTTKVNMATPDLKSADGEQFGMRLMTFGCNFSTLCDSLDMTDYIQSGSVYKIDGMLYGYGEVFEVTLDADGEVVSVYYREYNDMGDTVSEVTYLRKHVPTMVPMKAPTMDEDGCKLYYACGCGMYFEDLAATKKIADIDAWKTSDTMGLIHKLSYVPAPAPEKKDDKKTSPATGATMGLGALGLGVALLTVLKKKED